MPKGMPPKLGFCPPQKDGMWASIWSAPLLKNSVGLLPLKQPLTSLRVSSGHATRNPTFLACFLLLDTSGLSCHSAVSLLVQREDTFRVCLLSSEGRMATGPRKQDNIFLSRTSLTLPVSKEGAAGFNSRVTGVQGTAAQDTCRDC